MKKSMANVKVPDVEKDREQIIEESKRALEEMMKDPAMIDRLVELARVLLEQKAKQEKK